MGYPYSNSLFIGELKDNQSSGLNIFEGQSLGVDTCYQILFFLIKQEGDLITLCGITSQNYAPRKQIKVIFGGVHHRV